MDMTLVSVKQNTVDNSIKLYFGDMTGKTIRNSHTTIRLPKIKVYG